MPVFISHSHQDKDFVDKLAGQLVMRKAYVWMDRWEINVGDSLLDKVQAGIKSASALLIILSKASVASEWCKKELNAGLMRELGEKRVVVLPLLLEDCDIPSFLKEKKYADFRKDFDTGLRETLIGISSVTSDSQGRIEQPNFHTDFGIAWGNYGPYYCLQLRFVDHGELIAYSVLTEIRIICNARLTETFQEYELKGLAPFGRLKILTALNDYVRREKPKPFMLEDSLPKTRNLIFHDPKTGIGFDAEISSTRLGQDRGMNTLIDWPRHVEMMWKDLNNTIKSEEN
jgi:TIR domain